ncbi:MAG TPA: hypothetical protein DCS93_08430 [Microscillaceae bacterium]|nr:hypothetical protein [Microscillaceae bacterium]
MNNLRVQLRNQCFDYLKNLEDEASLAPNHVNLAALREILYRAAYANQPTGAISMQQLDWLTQVTLGSLIELWWASEVDMEQQLDAMLDILWSAVND